MNSEPKNMSLHTIGDWHFHAIRANWRVSTLAKTCGVSARTLERYFLKTFGQNPRTWLMTQRQKRAAELLHDCATVKETASQLGYAHATSFSRQFKKQTGKCPHDLAKAPGHANTMALNSPEHPPAPHGKLNIKNV